jgi:glutathione S-transferase
MSRRLYQIATCPYCIKVSAALDRLGLEYQAVAVDPGDRREVRRLSGQALVPVLVDGETVVADSTAILRYLVAAKRGAELLPEDPRGQALAWLIEGYADDRLGPLVEDVLQAGPPWPRPASGHGEARATAALARELDTIEGLLSGQDYVLGDSPTLADLALHAFLGRLGAGETSPVPEEFTRLRSWYARLRS